MPCSCWDVLQANGTSLPGLSQLSRHIGLPTVPIWDSPTSPRYPLDNLGMIELSPWTSVGYLVRPFLEYGCPIEPMWDIPNLPKVHGTLYGSLGNGHSIPCIKVGYPVWPWIIWEKNGLSHWTNIEHPNLPKVYGYSSKRQYLNCCFQCCLWLPLNKLRVESQYLANMSPSNPQLLIVGYNNSIVIVLGQV